jgi:hypothetical protein
MTSNRNQQFSPATSSNSAPALYGRITSEMKLTAGEADMLARSLLATRSGIERRGQLRLRGFMLSVAVTMLCVYGAIRAMMACDYLDADDVASVGNLIFHAQPQGRDAR